jgi:DNA invertase Pin-like site-specific DNA recombinase
MPTELAKAAHALRAARSRLDVAMVAAAERAIEAHADGKPATEIAAELGVNRHTVRRWLGK